MQNQVEKRAEHPVGIVDPSQHPIFPPASSENLWDHQLVRNGTTSKWVNRGSKVRKKWLFNDNLDQQRTYSIFNTLMNMKTTCKFYLKQFVDLEQENILFTISIGYDSKATIGGLFPLNTIFGGGCASSQMFVDRDLISFEEEYIKASKATTAEFYRQLSFPFDARHSKIGTFVLSYKTATAEMEIGRNIRRSA